MNDFIARMWHRMSGRRVRHHRLGHRSRSVWPVKARTTILMVGVTVIAGATTGCGSLNEMGGIREYPGVYPGVRLDAHWLAHGNETDYPLTTCVGLIDMPFSAAVDTVLLPYDIFHHSQSTNDISK
jgi:uncharacterized protein YceK